MAQLLDQWPIRERQQRYPWHEWLDGRPWRIKRGEDYHSRANTIVGNARAQAKRRGGTLRTQLFGEGTGEEAIVIQFRRDA